MKLSKILQIAVMVSLSVLNAAALSLTTDPDPDSYEPTVTPTLLWKEITFRERDIKDLEASYSDCNAVRIHHGTPGVTFRFKNNAARERNFIVKAITGRSALVGKNFSIQPGATVEFTLFLPLALEQGYRFGIYDLSIFETTPGARADRNMQSASFSMGHFVPGSNDVPIFLLSAGISSKKLWGDLTKAMNERKYLQRHTEESSHRYHRAKGKGRGSPYRFDAKQFRFPAEKWPVDWRIYSTYDSIFITANEYASLGTDAKSALDTYRTLGGAVFVTKGNDGFADVQEAAAALKPIDEACDILSGDIQMNYGSDSALLGDLQRIPMEAKATIPVKTLLLVLALFACIIVPVAVLRSVKRNTRIRLLAILPGAAAVFALVVAVSAYAFFGTTPTVRLQSVTVIDQTTKKAITLGQFGVFTPVSLDGQIAFPSDAAFARRHVRAQNDDDELVTVDSADEQRLVDGWVKPLVSAFFDFSRVCERPERLDFRVSPNGDVSVVNLLGAKVKSGHANVGGALWAFHDVEPGATAKAEKLGGAGTPRPPSQSPPSMYPFHDMQTTYGRYWEGNLKFVAESCKKVSSGEYVVEVEGSPFFPNPLQRKKSNMSAAGLVFGKFKEVAE
ncbi:MAG: hypothetical protein IJQ00_13230 [Kiritimatiellae bacterium]|nr:hypothetical protein [Kiritimatiellia bacterium]